MYYSKDAHVISVCIYIFPKGVFVTVGMNILIGLPFHLILGCGWFCGATKRTEDYKGIFNNNLTICTQPFHDHVHTNQGTDND